MVAKLEVIFYKERNENEPVRKWLRALEKETTLIIGEDLKKVQFRWPLGMPHVRNLGDGLWELRSTLPNRIARIIFILHGGNIILLHGFIKKTEQTTKQDIELAKKRANNVRSL